MVDDGTYWNEVHPKGPAKLVISLDEQRIGVIKAGELVGLSPISSGREGYDTHPGTFKVTEKDEDHRSSWYGAFVDDAGFIVVEDVDVRKDKPPTGTRFVGAEMRYFMRFNGPIGLHQGYLPGYPASHGCIRLPAKMAERIFHAVPHGTPVEVQQDAGLVVLRPAGTLPVPEAQAMEPALSELVTGDSKKESVAVMGEDAGAAFFPPVKPAVSEADKPKASEVVDARKTAGSFRFLGLGGGRSKVKAPRAAGATVYYGPELLQKQRPRPASDPGRVSQAPKPVEPASPTSSEKEGVRPGQRGALGSVSHGGSRKTAPEAARTPARRPSLPALRPITPNVPGIPPPPMTLAPVR